MSIATGSTAKVFPAIELSRGEIAFLWWFIQGGIMEPETRAQMRKAWGLCERHAWGWIAVESAFRPEYMHGPAILYEDLMERVVAFFNVFGPIQTPRVRRRLRERGACLMCESGFGPHSRAFVSDERVSRGRDLDHLRVFARRTLPYWHNAVCGLCAGTDSTIRCRKHFLEEANVTSADYFHFHKEFVIEMSRRLIKYSRSFIWGFHHTRTEDDAAALIMAVGWCSGWGTLLSIMGGPAESL
jgi:hypothetical protein